MGIRPDTMQAIAWAIAAGATGLAGAMIATFFYIVPTVGETLGIVAFVTVSLGGFGSVPGALIAGLLIYFGADALNLHPAAYLTDLLNSIVRSLGG